MDKILIIDDDKELCALIVQSVLKEGIEADSCHSGKDGLRKLGEGEYHLPILMFTAKNDSASKVRGCVQGRMII